MAHTAPRLWSPCSMFLLWYLALTPQALTSQALTPQALTLQAHRHKRDKADQDDNPSMVYQYKLTSNSRFGRIPFNALPGSEVPVDRHHSANGHSGYLKLQLFDNKPAIQGSEDKHITNSTHQPPLVIHSLPTGLQWDVSGEGWGDVGGPEHDDNLVFSVSSDLSIVLSNQERLRDVQEIAFWVVLVSHQKGDGDQAVSNPVAFIVAIDYEQAKQEGAAVYAGVVVLAVCLFALLIPLTVRTKRRLREGKPLCVCGSSSQSKDEHSPKPLDGDPAWKEDIAVLYNEGHYVEGHEMTSSTIQSHNIKSLSEPHFQPKWLDPHYKHEHEHPNYHRPRPPLHLSLSSASLAASSGTGASGMPPNSAPLTAALAPSPSSASLTARSISAFSPQGPGPWAPTAAPVQHVEKL